MTTPAGSSLQQRPNPPLLLGREREEQGLRGHLAAAIGGQGGLVLIGGVAGIGKTSLVASTAQAAVDSGALVFSGGCYDLTATPPYGPWRELAAEDGSQVELASLSDALTVRDEIAAIDGQGMLFARVREALTVLSASRPLMIVLEDLHWADPASLDLLRFISRQLVSAPLLLVATYRVDELTRRHLLYQLLPILVREASADRIELRALDTPSVRRIAVASYPLSEPNADRLLDYLQTHAEGNPFYVHELLRSLEEEGTLRPERDGWVLGDLAHVRVPGLLRQVVDGRMARLGDEIRDVLAMAAVIGQDVPLSVWKAVTGWSEDELLPVVERAVEAHLFEDLEDSATVRFSHALIREALYESVVSPRRRIWHQRVAEALMDLPGADPDAVAYHFTQAGDGRAPEWLVRAGERAQRAFAWLTAAERFKAAVLALESDPARAGERGWLLYRISRMLRGIDAGKAHDYLREAERVAAAVADPLLAAYALVDGGMLRCFQGDIRRGLTEMESGVEALDMLPAERTAAGLGIAAWVADSLPAAARGDALESPSGINPRRGALLVWLAEAGRFAEARSMGESYLDQLGSATRFDDLELGSIGDAHLALGLIYAMYGQVDAAREHIASARAAHRDTGHHGMLISDAGWELSSVVIPFQSTDLAERQRLKAEVEEVWKWARQVHGDPAGDAADMSGSPYYPGFGPLMDLLLLEGNWAGAREPARLATFDKIWRWWHLAAVAAMARHQGHTELAGALVREMLPEGPAAEPGGTFFRPAIGLQRMAAELALDAGDADLARAWIEAHDRWIAWSGSVLGQAEGQLLWARYHRVTGDSSTARECAVAALACADDPPQPLARLAAHRLLGELASEVRQFAEAEQHLAEALALAGACAAPFERALTLLAMAELHVASGDPGEARAALDEARAICTPLAAAPALARADALEARCEKLSKAGHGDRTGLSAREIEVLRLVAEGMTDAEVAAHLFISPRTVGQHLRSIYNKLGVSSRAAATRVAVERQLL